MAKRNVPKEIIKLVSDYGKLIKKRGISAERIVLFGSYARNLYRLSSDIDVCVVSKECGDGHEMQVELSKLTYGLDTRIQPHPVSLADYLENANPFISEIRKTGITI
jgi:predicted nucleotidyltransferase